MLKNLHAFVYWTPTIILQARHFSSWCWQEIDGALTWVVKSEAPTVSARVHGAWSVAVSLMSLLIMQPLHVPLQAPWPAQCCGTSRCATTSGPLHRPAFSAMKSLSQTPASLTPLVKCSSVHWSPPGPLDHLTHRNVDVIPMKYSR